MALQLANKAETLLVGAFLLWGQGRGCGGARLVALLEELSEDGRVGGAAVITPRVEAAAATTPLITVVA